MFEDRREKAIEYFSNKIRDLEVKKDSLHKEVMEMNKKEGLLTFDDTGPKITVDWVVMFGRQLKARSVKDEIFDLSMKIMKLKNHKLSPDDILLERLSSDE